MNETQSESRDDTAEETLVNYMPGMPTLSAEPGRIERFLTTLFRRRGALRPVARDRSDGE